jgi:arginase
MVTKIGLIGAPLCDGNRERGVENAPRALRNAGLVQALSGIAEIHDLGDVSIQTPAPDVLSEKLRNLDHVVSGCTRVMAAVRDAILDGFFPLVLGGDCSLFPGAFAGFSSAVGPSGAIYLDGHPDFHTPETTTSGYFSGMCLAAAVGKGHEALTRIGQTFPIVTENNVLLLGARERNIDPEELTNLLRSNVKHLMLERMRESKFEENVMEIAKSLPRHLYLHFDVDVLDGTEMPARAGTDYGVHAEGGLTLKELRSVFSVLAKLQVECMDITLYDPKLDKGGIYAQRLIESLRAFFS